MGAGRVVQTVGDATVVFDPTHTYRYRLSWAWGAGPRVVFIMLNPSTATAEVADPTIRRVWRFAHEHWDAGRVEVVNLYALRATDPRALRGHPDPIGPDNDDVLLDTVRGADSVVAAWGTRGGTRGAQVRGMLTTEHVPVQVLRLTRGGAPAHPLYLPATTVPFLWPA